MPIVEVTINGTSYPVSSVSNGLEPPTFTAQFGVPVSVVEGTNVFDIGATGFCQQASVATRVVVTVAPDLCAAPVFDHRGDRAGLGLLRRSRRGRRQGLPAAVRDHRPDQALDCRADAIICAP